MICALDATSLFGFNSWRLCMAFNPIGVAALSRPSMFAEKFMMMCPPAGWLFGTPGNKRLKNGPTIRATKFIAPAFSPMFISPSQSVITPAKGSAISITDVLAISKVACTIAGSTAVSLNAISLMMPTINAITKNAIQM